MANGRASSSADIGSNFSDYRGDAMLGGANVQPIKIDLDPLQKLETFTNLQNKTYYEQQQKNVNAVLDNFAKVSDIDIANLHGDDRKKLMDEYTKVVSQVKDNLHNIPPSSDVGKSGEWRLSQMQKIGQLEGKYNTMKKRALTRVTDLDNINKKYGQDAKAIGEATKMYDQYFNSTDGALDPLPLFTPIELPTPKPVTATIRAYKTGGDDTQDYTINVDNLDATSKQISAGILLGTQKTSIYPPETIKDAQGKDVNNPAYAQWAKGKSKAEILMAKMQNLGNPDIYSFAQKTAATYNEAIKPYLLPDDPAKVDEKKLLASGNQVLIDNYKNLSSLNQYATSNMATLSQKGGAYSNQGINYNVPTEVDAATFQPGVIGDMGNVTPEQLILAQSHQAYEAAGGDKVQVVNKHTGDKTKNAIDLANVRLRQREQNFRESQAGGTNNDDIGNAKTVLNQAVDIINSGTPIRVVSKDGKSATEMIRISDPIILKEFKGIDGSENPPTAINYDPKTDRAIMVYGSENETGGLNYDKEFPLDKRAWLKTMTKISFPNKDIGNINNIVDQVITDNGNSLYGIAQKAKGAANTQRNNVSVIKYNGKDYTQDEINEAAKLNGVTPEEYINFLNKQKK